MKNQSPSPIRRIGFALGAALVVALTGCTTYVETPRAQVSVAQPVFVEQDDYVYYPGYDVYYSNHRHQYAYMEGGAWVSRPSPRGVSVNVLLASPSVRMDFHDSPANHHGAIVKRYPRNWAPARENPGRREERREERHDPR